MVKRVRVLWQVTRLASLVAVGLQLSSLPYAQPIVAVNISPTFPSELNPPFTPGPAPRGGAATATPEQAAAFAWHEFIALSWPAGPQQGLPGQRDTASSTLKFSDPTFSGPLVWQTYRGKVEIFPGTQGPAPNPPFQQALPPPGFPGPSGDKSYGYDALPAYNYSKPFPVACDPKQAGDLTPWINLDETDQITLDNMYAGVVQPDSSPGNSQPQLIRFLAKANRSEYVYTVGNSTPSDQNKLWWAHIPKSVVDDTKAYLAKYQASPPSGSKNLVSQPDGTTEIKAGWRPLNPSERVSGRVHTQTVRFYEANPKGPGTCYIDATWGLVSLHIIQKTPSAPFFIYATFEQADNLLTAAGVPVEDVDGRLKAPAPASATTPLVCLTDPKPPNSAPLPIEKTSALGTVVQTDNSTTCQPASVDRYCTVPGRRLFYRNALGMPPNGEPSGGNVCVDNRENVIPSYVVEANVQAHAAMAAYLKRSGIASAPWLFYKLINVQYLPYDKIPIAGAPNGSLYPAKPPYAANNPAPSGFYQANIVVETNRSLQLFSGGLSPNVSSDWNADGTEHKNTYYGGHFYNMGGCMGCHGSQGQNPLVPYGAGDFSIILARGTVSQPEVPSIPTATGMTSVPRNRSLSR